MVVISVEIQWMTFNLNIHKRGSQNHIRFSVKSQIETLFSHRNKIIKRMWRFQSTTITSTAKKKKKKTNRTSTLSGNSMRMNVLRAATRRLIDFEEKKFWIQRKSSVYELRKKYLFIHLLLVCHRLVCSVN